MAAFVASIGAASKRGSRALREFAKNAVAHFDAAPAVREYRPFAKTKAKRLAVMATMMNAVGRVQRLLARAIATANQQRVRLTKSRKLAQARVLGLYQTMKKLLPQIAYWHRTGYVAKNKIISVYIPELYSIVRGLHRPLWEGAHCLCLRPRRAQRRQRRHHEEEGCETRGPGPPGQRAVGSQRADEEWAAPRAHSHLSRNRHHQERAVRIQSATSPLSAGRWACAVNAPYSASTSTNSLASSRHPRSWCWWDEAGATTAQVTAGSRAQSHVPGIGD